MSCCCRRSRTALHGYAVKESLSVGSLGRFDVPTGTIYSALHRLARAGLIDDEWSVVAGRKRRTYRLTEQGRARLHSERSDWRAFAAAVGAVLEGPPWPNLG